ncbi:PREDICTED: uncharacterized protein LOC109580172 [Amphimedon queenslandica]|uniref:Uncharacterized protein n=1 Tax=Amphimedon queenslandica TaxID=400682 RepID=A0AAN0IVY1_AMPQE|nr:PREDICTED: uncharacterized protein LOC109580172 [Amphimedon queenslandica]|eukprot:XP_019848626.1 PREDICTED: uncharacterized protein LOC109580172 [Amphimedon queenslandica]
MEIRCLINKLEGRIERNKSLSKQRTGFIRHRRIKSNSVNTDSPMDAPNWAVKSRNEVNHQSRVHLSQIVLSQPQTPSSNALSSYVERSDFHEEEFITPTQSSTESSNKTLNNTPKSVLINSKKRALFPESYDEWSPEEEL